jgi:hypothetical protein
MGYQKRHAQLGSGKLWILKGTCLPNPSLTYLCSLTYRIVTD